MRQQYKAFRFDGQTYHEDMSSGYRIINATLDNDFYMQCIRGPRSIVEDKIPGRDIPYFYEVDDEPLEFDVTFAFSEVMTKTQIKQVARKFFAPIVYKELTFGDYDLATTTYTAKTPTYKVIFHGETDINYVQQSANVNIFQVASTSTIEAPKENASVYTLNYVKTGATTQSYVKTGGTILSGENIITGITDFTNLRIGQKVVYSATLLGTITNINLQDQEITISANSASTRTGSFTFTDDKRLSFANITNLSVGMLVVGTGVPSNTFIDEIYDVANNVISVDKDITVTYTGSGSITFYDLNRLVIDNLDNIEINQYIFSGSVTINNKKIIAIDEDNSILTLNSEPTTYIGSSVSPISIVIAGPTYTGSKTLNFTAGSYNHLMLGNTVYVNTGSNYFYGIITGVTSTSITVNITSANGYVNLVEPNITVTRISSDNGYIAYLTLTARADRPYGYSVVTGQIGSPTTASQISITSTGDITFFPSMALTNPGTTGQPIRIYNETNGSTITFSQLYTSEVVTINAILKTISSNQTPALTIYERWSKDDLFLSPGTNVIKFQTYASSSWGTLTVAAFTLTGEAPVYIYDTN
jgi:hypothetical protein